MIRIPPQRGGWLEVICGPMFSGKSEEMIRRLRRAEIAGQSVVIFKPRSTTATTRRTSSATRASGCAPFRSPRPSSWRAGAGFDVVGIDEVQFFEHSVVGAALELANRRRRVVAAGLDQDFRRLPFGPMPELLSHAEFVDKLQAVCHRCGGPATTTQRPRRRSTRPLLGRDRARRGGGAVRGALPRLPRGRRGRRGARRRVGAPPRTPPPRARPRTRRPRRARSSRPEERPRSTRP